MTAVFAVDACRTPVGKIKGALSAVRPDHLTADVLSALLARSPWLDPARIDDVYWGAANQAGEDNRNVARMGVLLAGLPVEVPGATVNRLCGSSLEAIASAARAIASGEADIILAGGAESMTRAPFVLPRSSDPFPREAGVADTRLGWRLVSPRMQELYPPITLGETAENVAERYGVSRERQDEFALRSHQRAAAAWDSGFYGGWVVPVPDTELERDETIRPDTSLEKLAKLKPAFVKDGSVTAGNASPLNDGAGAMLLADEGTARMFSREPLARIVGRGAAGVDPDVFGIAPVEAANRALKSAGIGWDDVAVVELNEAFASQCLADLSQWPELDPEKLNPNGGAIAVGHPLGASGVRILGSLAHELRRRGGGYGVATLCIGVGQGLAVVLEA
jgi:acetyl-CoA acetyltransferase family protein